MSAKGSPRTIGRYEVIGELAVGGMAEIWLARIGGPNGFERLVVVKRIFPHLARDPALVAMFLDEARIVARLNHRNVVQVHELSEQDGEYFLAMEYLEGESVAGLMRRLRVKDRALPPALAAYIVSEACLGLQAAHDLTDDDGVDLGVVHRDVSPQNLFVSYDATIKLLDFGIATATERMTKTEPGQIKGKFAYMSPEQCRGKNLDRRSDIFSLGIVMHELLTGKRLFARDNHMDTFQAICQLTIPRPSHVAPGIPPALDEVCMRALARQRSERYATCAEMRRDLAAARRGVSDGDEAGALSALMDELFPERIAEKRELLRRARLGQPLGDAPVAETDIHVEMPTLGSPSGSTVATLTVPPAHPKRGRTIVVAAIGMLAASGVAAGAWWKASVADATPTATATSASTDLAPSTPVESSAPSPSASLEAPPRRVTLRVRSLAGALVTVDGANAGTAPYEVALPASPIPVEVRVARAGHATQVVRVVPTADVELDVALPRAAGRVHPPSPPRAPTTPATPRERPEKL